MKDERGKDGGELENQTKRISKKVTINKKKKKSTIDKEGEV